MLCFFSFKESKAQEMTVAYDLDCFKVWSMCVCSGSGYQEDSGLLVLLVPES